MTLVRTVFIDGDVWQSLIETDAPRLMTLDQVVITARSVDWPSSTSYGDFDENGWFRTDPLDAVRA